MGLWIFVSLAAISIAILSNQKAQMSQLHLRWVGDGSVKLSATKDGPFIVTHLANYEAGKVVAALPQPIAIIDSGGETISADTITKLVWRECVNGEIVDAPPKDLIVALYFQAEIAKRYTEHNP